MSRWRGSLRLRVAHCWVYSPVIKQTTTHVAAEPLQVLLNAHWTFLSGYRWDVRYAAQQMCMRVCVHVCVEWQLTYKCLLPWWGSSSTACVSLADLSTPPPWAFSPGCACLSQSTQKISTLVEACAVMSRQLNTFNGQHIFSIWSGNTQRNKNE